MISARATEPGRATIRTVEFVAVEFVAVELVAVQFVIIHSAARPAQDARQPIPRRALELRFWG